MNHAACRAREHIRFCLVTKLRYAYYTGLAIAISDFLLPLKEKVIHISFVDLPGTGGKAVGLVLL